MAPRVVRHGEHLDVIAYRHGVSVEEVWNGPGNRGLKSRRPGPHMLVEGDIVDLPARRHPKPIDLELGSLNTVVATIPKVKVELLLDGKTGPVAGEPWHIEANGEKAEGTTGADGKIAFAVRVTTPRVKLFLDRMGAQRQVAIGALDPPDAATGIIHRLNNLGYDAGDAVRALTQRAVDALMTFQRDQKLAPTGEPNAETMSALVAAHGS